MIAGDERWAVVEDAGRLRDALGVSLPLGISEALLHAVADPLTDLISRYARTHGPFTTDEVAARFGLGSAIALQVLRRLARDGRLTEGEFRPQATGTEWIEPGVLRRIRSRSLAAARQQVEPVDPATYARFLPVMAGRRLVAARRRGRAVGGRPARRSRAARVGLGVTWCCRPAYATTPPRCSTS